VPFAPPLPKQPATGVRSMMSWQKICHSNAMPSPRCCCHRPHCCAADAASLTC
jgi:hypothetical protein